MKKMQLALALVVGLFASSAFAQLPPVIYSSQAYSPMVGGTALSGWPSVDDSAIDVPLGFSFPYLGQNYTTVRIDSNGWIGFATSNSDCLNSGCYDNNGALIPSTTLPNFMIAAWWDDHQIASGTVVKYTTAPGEFEVEYTGLGSRGSNVYALTFKIKLTSAGTIFIHYGSNGSGATGGTASVGIEGSGAAGTGTFFTLPGATTPCSPNCTMAQWPANTLITIGQPNEADLAVTQVLVNSITTIAGGNLQFSVTPTFRNYGLQPANNFFWKAYLSTDRVLTAADTLLYTSSAAISVAATSAVTAPAVTFATTTAPPAGQYYILVEADSSNVVTEASETNNVGSMDNFFVNGLDLVASAVSGPANTGPGNMITVNAKWFNQGTTAPSGPVQYRILLSNDAAYSADDFVLQTFSRTVSGGQTIDENLTFAVPMGVRGGDQYYILQIDHPGAIPEANEMNNVAVSATKVAVRQADLVNGGGNFLDPLTGVPTRVGYFGQTGRASVQISNVGGADARNFDVSVVISRDLTLSLLGGGDTIIVPAHTVANVAQGTSTTVTFDFTLPLKDSSGANFTSGQYYLFFLVDSLNAVSELNEGDNNLPLTDPVFLSAPNADLAVVRVDVPAAAAAGEVLPMSRTIKNVGNVAAPATNYRCYASANSIIDVGDVPLSIVGATANADHGTVTLGVGESDSKTELVLLPGSMNPGAYYIGCIVDYEKMLAEINETNNAGASVSTVQVVASALGVASTSMPDAVVGRPYSYRLASRGAQGATTWSMFNGSTLPAGLTLDPASGLISGTPTGTGTAVFNVSVQDTVRSAVGVLVLRVLPATSELEISSTALPPVVNSPSITYDFTLSASGGVQPYTWRLVSGTLPGGANRIRLDPATGQISGSPAAGTAESSNKVTFEVRDAYGSRATREFTVRVVALGSIVISATSLTDALVNVDYTIDITAKNSDSSPLVKPIAWRLVRGALPDGLALSVLQDVAVISGTPTVAGVFDFQLEVEDGKGRTDSTDLSLRVYPARLKVTSADIPASVQPDESTTFTITAGAGVTASYRLISGALPPGLSLDGATGVVTGTVASDSAGSYSFVVEAIDTHNAVGWGSFGMQVVPAVTRSGCAAGPGDVALWLLLLVVPLMLRRPATQRASSRR